jgi:hypothetical protein
MSDFAELHVTWEEVVELARRSEDGKGGDPVLSSQRLARLVVQFHSQTVGANVVRRNSPSPRQS